MQNAFRNIKIIDMSQGIAGPMSAGILARQGANVIKVEPPNGDWIRGAGVGEQGMSPNAIAGNFNKRGIVIDASKPAGREAILRLLRDADVLVENFRDGVMKRLGLDYDTVRAINPRIVYCSVTGFGPRGPLAGKAATDSVVQAYTGMTFANGGRAGPPRRIGIYVPDNISAIYSAQAISAALFERFTTGTGQRIEISLAQCCAAIQAAPMIDTFTHPDPAYWPTALSPAGDYKTADGYITVAALTQEMFLRLCKVVGREDWLADPRFADDPARKTNAAAMNAAFAAEMLKNTTAHWLNGFEAADVLVSAINDYPTFRDQEQTRAMGYFTEVDQAPIGKLTVPNLPGVKVNLRAAPRVGEHTLQVLLESGFSQAEIDALIAQGVVHQRAEQA